MLLGDVNRGFLKTLDSWPHSHLLTVYTQLEDKMKVQNPCGNRAEVNGASDYHQHEILS